MRFYNKLLSVFFLVLFLDRPAGSEERVRIWYPEPTRSPIPLPWVTCLHQSTPGIGTYKQAIIAAWGVPDSKAGFILGRGVNPFRSRIYNVFPLVKENFNMEIQELTWGEGDCNKTLWFTDIDSAWVLFDSMAWNKQANF